MHARPPQGVSLSKDIWTEQNCSVMCVSLHVCHHSRLQPFLLIYDVGRAVLRGALLGGLSGHAALVGSSRDVLVAEVTQKKVARKPKDHTISLSRYWRSFGPGGRSCVVLGFVTIAILLLCIFALSVSRLDRAMAKELELEQQRAAAKQDKRRQVHLLTSLFPATIQALTHSKASSAGCRCALFLGASFCISQEASWRAVSNWHGFWPCELHIVMVIV